MLWGGDTDVGQMTWQLAWQLTPLASITTATQTNQHTRKSLKSHSLPQCTCLRDEDYSRMEKQRLYVYNPTERERSWWQYRVLMISISAPSGSQHSWINSVSCRRITTTIIIIITQFSVIIDLVGYLFL